MCVAIGPRQEFVDADVGMAVDDPGDTVCEMGAACGFQQPQECSSDPGRRLVVDRGLKNGGRPG
jgi:hypothetical protein